MAADVQACLAFMVRFALFIVCKAKKHLYFYNITDDRHGSCLKNDSGNNMKNVIILKLFLTNIVFAQITKTDTIDYTSISNQKSYWTVKVKTKESKEVIYKNTAVLSTWIVKSKEDVQPKWSTTTSIGDTLMWTDWDCNKNNYPIGTHSCAKVNINKTTNTVNLDNYVWGQKKTFPRKFKVLKWTKSQIVLLDLSNLHLKRIYTFE